MTERLRRQWAACEAESLGRGGPSIVAEATGLSRTTIWSGRRELKRRANQPRDDLAAQRVRAPGGGRHLVEQKDSAILTDLQVLVDSSTRGDPQSPLCWTSKSVRRVAEELSERGHAVSHQTVAALLDDLGYSLQANRKTKTTPIAMPSSNTSVDRCVPSRRTTNRPSQSTPRRRKTSGIFAIPAGVASPSQAGGGPCQGLSGQAAG